MDQQHFLLHLECGHFYQVSAVTTLNGEPHAPDYVGKTMQSKCCTGSRKVMKQESVPFVVGPPHLHVNPHKQAE